MTTFLIMDEDKWMHQNDAQFTGAFFDGVLLDNFVLSCKRGYAAVYEHHVNEWTSNHVCRFAPYKDRKAVDALWSEFYDREKGSER